MTFRRLFVAVAVLISVSSSLHSAAPAVVSATVDLFNPQGTAKSVRQVTARFSVPMVALGDPLLADPFDIQCTAAGRGRWADTRNWVYDFDADVPAGLLCTFTIKKELKALGGGAVGGTQTFSFSTGGPAVIGSYPRDGWSMVDEDQLFLLKLDAPASAQSVQEHARCIVQGLGEEIPVQVLTGPAREAMLNERKALGYEYFRLLSKSGAQANVRVRDRSLESAEANITVLRCQRTLPPASQLQLLWGRGIETLSGVATAADQKLAFRIRPAFTARAECARANARSGCLPMQPITLRFSAPVPRDLAMAVRLKLPKGKTQSPVRVVDAPGSTVQVVEFAAPFPERQAVTILLPPGLKDDAGRALENAARFPLTVNVDDFPPLARFSGSFGILEASEGGVLPVTLRNVEPQVATQMAAMPTKLLHLETDPAAIVSWMRRVDIAGEPRGEYLRSPAAAAVADEDPEDDGSRWRENTGTTSVFGAGEATKTFRISRTTRRSESEVIGIPLKEKGFYVVEIESRKLGNSLLGRDQVRYVATSALVTDMAVHFKWGRENSIVWVTRLQDGRPVAGADVVILQYCSGNVAWRGTTDKDGLATVPQSLGSPHSNDRCNKFQPGPLFVSASKEGDLSFALSSWDQGIEPGQFGLPMGNEYTTRIYHTVFDRPLFRAGETVSMKHFLRRHVMSGLAFMEAMPATRTIAIRHQGSGQQYTFTANFGADGIAESQWKIPAEAKLGDYVVFVTEDQNRLIPSGRFKVEQYRLPSMRASVTGSALPLVRPASADIDLHVAYLSGGGASGLPVKVRTLVQPVSVQFPGYSDYQFGGPAVTEGVFSNENNPFDFDFEAQPEEDSTRTQVIPLTLDAAGALRVTIPGLPQLDGAARLTAELEYADANGELLTTSGHVQLVPASLSLGIRREGWAGSGDQVRFRVVALDLKGQPRARQPVKVALYQTTRFSYRKRLIGGFYAYETTRETRKLAASCQGQTDAQGLLTCEVAPGVSGEVTLHAETTDDEGHASGATTSVWVYGKDGAWFGGTSGDRMDVLPEQKSYEAGETARFQVRMPFREATALVTVEREGVLSSFVTRLDASQPVLEVPITGEYAPNVFVSVLAVRGRVAGSGKSGARSKKDEEITATVDLNKPAYRLGIAAIKVGWQPHRLDVRVSTERATYKVRELAAVKIHVARADGGALPAGTEVAISAVDSALLELAPNKSWDLLAAMMGERGLEVMTSTAQMQVVGKRHYGRKAVPSGGGGGRDRARELFDSLLFWQGRVKVDAAGDATVSIPLNDSSSEFRVVAVASGSAGFFGTGNALLTTNQDLILLSGLPPLVREGDDFLATFTLRNTTNRTIAVDVTGQNTAIRKQSLQAQHVEIGAGQSRDIAWRVSVPVNQGNLRWEVATRETGGNATDKIAVTQNVIPAWPVRTYQATIAQLDGSSAIPASRPAAAIAGRGGLEVTLQAKLGDSLDGVREFLSLYRYICVEQQLSRAMGQRDRALWDTAMQRLPAYLDNDGLLRYFPSDQIPGDDSLTAYALAIADEGGWPVAEPARTRMLNALKLFVQGRIVRGSALPTADLTIRKLAAIEALARYGQADSAMLGS
ncbi:MAG: MG2 domain-containing protein, partial [Pseudomonadota bacterium]